MCGTTVRDQGDTVKLHFVRAAFAAALLASTGASAQFMKPGPSPESGFAGVWRVIGAKAAPWAKPGPRAERATPLLEHAIEISEGSVKGPAAIACADARFSSGVSAPDELFDGRLRDRAEAAKALGLSSTSVTTYRVICDGKPRDWYVDDNAALRLSEGDVIYTLERPSGDPKKVAVGFSGPSFDCAKANTAGELTICRDADLSAADRRLDAAFRRLKSTETPASFATVQSAQRAWLAYVTKRCHASGAMPEDVGEQNALRECLTDHYGDRADRLEGVEVVKSGSLVIEPRMRVITRERPETEESDIYPWMNGGAAADAFNRYVAKALALEKHRMDDKDLFPFGEDVADMKLFARRTYSLARLDARVASLQIATFDYTGGAHEAINESSLNWDVVRAKPFGLDDVFAKDKPWRKFATDFCLGELHEDFEQQGAPDPDRDSVDAVVGDGDNWLWGEDAATVHFTVYTIASFSGGESDVRIPYAALASYLRTDAPVSAALAKP
jgi:uncharacterized protein YecT (DUF1311 family)